MINELHYRELFYRTFNSLSKIGRRKTVDEKTRKDLEYQLRMKMAELSEINALLKEKGTKPLYQLSYNVVYGNYRRLLEEEIGRLQDQLRVD